MDQVTINLGSNNKMRRKIKMKNIKIAALACSLLFAGNANAGLINADFNQSLTGWTGAVENDVEYIDNITDFNEFSDIFSTDGNSVSLNQTDDYWNVYLYQEFTFDNNATTFSLEYSSTDFFGDEAYVTLIDSSTSDILWDFSNGSSFDVSSFAMSGKNAVIEFALIDFDFFNDSLKVSDLSISSSTVSVPEPSGLAILALGFLVIRRRLSLGLK